MSNKRQKLTALPQPEPVCRVMDTFVTHFAADYGLVAVDRRLTRDGIQMSVPGFKWLDEGTHSFLIYIPAVLNTNEWSFNEFWDVRRSVERTRNPMNCNQFVRRIQGTYGAPYKFGAQTSQQIGGDDESKWPAPICEAIADARGRSSLSNPVMVHVNWYDNESQIAPHADNEGINLPGAPIFSYTLIRDSPPRKFQVYDKTGYKHDGMKCPVHREYTLENGSLLIMGGTMQHEYVHGVSKPKPRKEYTASRRINITVRFLL